MHQVDSNVVLTVPEPGKVEMKHRPYPNVKPGSVLVKTEIAAVCVDDRMFEAPLRRAGMGVNHSVCSPDPQIVSDPVCRHNVCRDRIR